MKVVVSATLANFYIIFACTVLKRMRDNFPLPIIGVLRMYVLTLIRTCMVTMFDQQCRNFVNVALTCYLPGS